MYFFTKQFKQKYLRHFIILGVGLIVTLFLINYIYYQTEKRSRAQTVNVTFSFKPSSTNAQPDTDFPVTVSVKPNADMTIRGYRVKLGFDKAKVQVKNIEYLLGGVSAGLSDDNSSLATVNQFGVVNLRGEITSSAGQPLTTTLSSDIAIITFTSNSTEGSSISVEAVNSYVSKISTDLTLIKISAVSTSPDGDFKINAPISITPSPTGVSSPTPTGTTSAAINLNLKLRFQGILKKPAKSSSMPVKVMVMSNDGKKASGSATFSSDSSGIFSGSVNMNAPAGTGYKVFVKGPKHLQKRICDLRTTETLAGTYSCETGRISLNPGKNDFDFSGIYQLVGDLPAQDGIVNSYDISLVRNNAGSNAQNSL